MEYGYTASCIKHLEETEACFLLVYQFIVGSGWEILVYS